MTLTDSNGQYHNNSANLGAVYYLNTGASVNAIDCQFQNNESTSGGVFYLASDSSLTLSNAQILNNKATIKGGVLWSVGSSHFKISSSTISGNQAPSVAILGVELSELITSSSITSTHILNNISANDQTIRLVGTELFLTDITYSDNIGLNIIGGINTVRTTLSITASTFSNSEATYASCAQNPATNIEGGFILSELSSMLTITDSSFTRGCATKGGAVLVSGTTVTTIDRVIFEQNYAHQEGGAAYFIEHSGGVIHNSTFTANIATRGADIYLNAPQNGADSFTLTHLIFNLIKRSQSIYLTESLVSISESRFQDYYSATSGSTPNNLLECFSCVNLTLSSSIFVNISTQSVVLVSASPQQDQIFFHNNSFTQIEASSSGGAIQMRQANPFTISFNNFSSVIASGFRGGAILLDTLAEQGTISNNIFSNCQAETGGALAFNYHKPQLTDNQFFNNYASVYGDDIASYAVALSEVSAQEAGRTLANSVIPNIQSGGPLSIMYLALKDELGQIVASDSTSTVTVIIYESGSQNYATTLRGTLEFPASNGVFVVEGIEVISEPGTTVTLKLRTTGIDSSLPLVDQAAEFWNSLEVIVQLRYCIAGEEFLITGECNECSAGSYLLEAPTAPQNCNDCPSNAVCLGGTKLGPQSGFWRQDAMSVNFLKCYNPTSCLGTIVDVYAPEGTCHHFYRGILCAECIQNFSRNASFECQACPELWKNILLILAILFSAVAVIVIVVRITLASANSEKSQLSVFIKILFSHLQMLSLVASLELSWPSQIETFFQKSGAVSQASQQIVSLDCLIKHYSFIKRFYLYLIVFFFLPILLMMISTFVWRFCIQIRKPWTMKSVKNYATILIILFLVHPTLTSVLFKAFYCQNINGKYRLVQQLSEVCWSSSHLYFAGSFGVIGLLFWVIGIPFTTWTMLREVKHNLSMKRVRAQYGFLFKGYKHKAYYWETVIMFRKVLVSFISVFLKSYGVVVQALVSELLLVFFILITLRVQPYDTRILNFIEILSLCILSLTVYCGIYFLSSKDPSDSSFIFGRDYAMTSGGRWFFFLAIVISNLLFVLVWLRYLVNTFFESLLTKHPKLYICCCLCCSQQKFKAKMRKHHDRNVFKERIDQIQRLKNYLAKAQEFYKRGDIFEEADAFDRAIQATKIELSQFSYEEVDGEKFVVRKNRNRKVKIIPETQEKSFRELDSRDMLGGNMNQTIQYIDSKHMLKLPKGGPSNQVTITTNEEDQNQSITKAARRKKQENYEENDVQKVDFQIDCLSLGQNEAYIDIVSQKREVEESSGDFIPSQPIKRRSLRRQQKEPLTRRKSIFIPVKHDFELDLKLVEFSAQQDYNLEFIDEPKLRKKSEETSARSKLKRSESTGQSILIYSQNRGNPSPSISSARSFEDLPKQLLDDEDLGYDLSFK